LEPDAAASLDEILGDAPLDNLADELDERDGLLGALAGPYSGPGAERGAVEGKVGPSARALATGPGGNRVFDEQALDLRELVEIDADISPTQVGSPTDPGERRGHLVERRSTGDRVEPQERLDQEQLVAAGQGRGLELAEKTGVASPGCHCRLIQPGL